MLVRMRIERSGPAPWNDSRPDKTIEIGGASYAVPRCFTVEIDDGSLDWDVRLEVSAGIRDDGGLDPHQITEVRIRRRDGGPPASAADVRKVPLGALLTKALLATVDTMRFSAIGERSAVWSAHEMPETPAPEEVARSAAGRARRNSIDPVMVRQSLELYEYAKRSKIPDPFGWVGDQLGISRSTANKYKKIAEESKP